MSNYYLHSVILKDCSYSKAAYKLLKKHQDVRTIFTFVNHYNKENYKNNDINTFPQIYLKKNNRTGSLLIGGYDDLKILFDLFYKKKYSNDNIDEVINNNKNWTKKSLLRFIQLINS